MDDGLEAELQSGFWQPAPGSPKAAPSPGAPDRRLAAVQARVATRLEPLLAERWDELAVRAGSSPYLRPGWVAAWWSAFGEGRLEIRMLERAGRLIALLPLQRRFGVLRSVTNPHTPEFGLLAEDHPAAVALARAIFAGRPRRVSIASLGSSGPEVGICRRTAAENGYRTSVRAYQRSPYLEVDGDWDRYHASLGTSFSAGLRRSRRQLERLGASTVEIADGRTALAERLEEAFAVESSGWKDARGTAIRAHVETREFYTAVARWAVDSGLLRLFFLRLGGRALAMYFALEQRGVLYLLKGGYDPAFARVSPGKLLLHHVVEDAFRRGLARIELHGGADDYKLRFTSIVRERVMFDAFAGSAAGRIDWTVHRYGRPVAKRMLRRFAAQSDASNDFAPSTLVPGPSRPDATRGSIP